MFDLSKKFDLPNTLLKSKNYCTIIVHLEAKILFAELRAAIFLVNHSVKIEERAIASKYMEIRNNLIGF